MDFFSVFQEIWAVRALIASGLVGIMCGTLGAFIVLRNMSMIGDALSHAILPGVVLAFVFVGGYSSLGFFVGAVIAGLISAYAITWIQQNVQTKNDAAIGIVFTAMFSIGVIGISWISRNEGVHLDLKDFLFGNVLTVSDEDLMLTAAVTGFVILSVMVLYRYLFISTFQSVIAETMGISVKAVHYFLMLLLSFSVVASLQTVGVILVVAMLITPASTALLLSDRLERVVVISALLGLMAAVAGLLIAIRLETTPGPAMAVTATAMYLVVALIAPKKGIIAKFVARRGQQFKVEIEDTLKQALKLHRSGSLNIENLTGALGFPRTKTNRLVSTLNQKELVTLADHSMQLTSSGVKRANALLRAHRLWETYLVDQVGLNTEQIHEDAEQLEHVLTEDILDEVDRELGYPTTDPHGSPIPRKHSSVLFALSQLHANQTGTISSDQPDSIATHALWQMGLEPNKVIRVIENSGDTVIIDAAGETNVIRYKVADKVNVIPGDYSSSDPI
jgi:manganese/iron transport system permease protein